MKKIIKIFLIMGLILLLIPFFTESSIMKLNKGEFVSTSISRNTYEPNDQIQINFNYKNTWSDTYKFLIEADLDDQHKSIQKYIGSGNIYSDSFIFTAPATEGNYSIKLKGSVGFIPDRWTGGDGRATIPIEIKKSDELVISKNPTLTINSNIDNVNVAYDYESKTIDETKTVEFNDIPINKTFEFIATKNGYKTEIFNITINEDFTYELNMEADENYENVDSDKNVDSDENINTLENTNSNKIIISTIDQNNQPLSDCKVFLNNQTKITNSDGEVIYYVTDGDYLLLITHDNYLTLKQNYNLEQSVKITVKMTNKEEFTGSPIINTNIDNNNYIYYFILLGAIIIIMIILLIISTMGDKSG